MESPLLLRLAVALAVGLIVGIERGWNSRLEASGQRTAGLRTFALAGLLGGVLAALAGEHPVVLAAGLLVVGGFVVAAYVITAPAMQDFGMTTEFALVTTCALGALAVAGAPFEATAAAILIALVLGLKTEVHKVLHGLGRNEVMATLQLLLIAAVLVPLLPNRPVGPWAINPRMIGMLVLLIAGLSYLGYFAVRVFGARLGLLLTALFGGLSSSTAVTVAYARRSRGALAHASLYGAGIALAATMMTPRVVLEISVVNRALLPGLLPTIATLALVPLVAVAWINLRSHQAGVGHEVRLGNPLQLRAAVTFGVLLSLLFIAGDVIKRNFGDAGIYTMAALAGLVDVDAISLSLARAATQDLDSVTAQRGIVIALLVNTTSKAVLAALLGGPAIARTATAALGMALVAGAAVAMVTLG
ncbi:MAG TPA: MgtC/SapB family protein [Woeseiaceae bacterium]|nr:MgtC/SapB family protein [Woeseiaceae bacterium]